jgi:type IV pilus assembly protein PilO
VSKIDLKNLQPKALIPLIVGGVLVLGVLGWFVLVRPQSAQIKSLKAQEATIQQQIDDQRAKTAAARAVPKIHVADVYRLAKAMPDNVDMPDLLLELSQLARETGITFDSIAPGTSEAKGGYTVIPVTVSFDGNFFNLCDFLYRLRTLVDVHDSRLEATGRLFSVDTLQFSEAAQKFPQIRAELAINAFVYGDAATTTGSGVTSGAGTTDTTSTDTTSTETTPTDTTATTSTEPTASASGPGAP